VCGDSRVIEFSGLQGVIILVFLAAPYIAVALVIGSVIAGLVAVARARSSTAGVRKRVRSDSSRPTRGRRVPLLALGGTLLLMSVVLNIVVGTMFWDPSEECRVGSHFGLGETTGYPVGIICTDGVNLVHPVVSIIILVFGAVGITCIIAAVLRRRGRSADHLPPARSNWEET
jgi:hypothetical protein